MLLTSVAPRKPSSSSPSLSSQSQSRLFEIKVQRKIRLGICGECGWVGESLRGNTKEVGNRMDALLLLFLLRCTHFPRQAIAYPLRLEGAAGCGLVATV